MSKGYSYKNVNGKVTLIINGKPATPEQKKRLAKIENTVRNSSVETLPLKKPIDDRDAGVYTKDRLHIHKVDTPEGVRRYSQEGSPHSGSRGRREKLKTSMKMFRTPEDSLRTEDYEYIKKKKKYSKKYLRKIAEGKK